MKLVSLRFRKFLSLIESIAHSRIAYALRILLHKNKENLLRLTIQMDVDEALNLNQMSIANYASIMLLSIIDATRFTSPWRMLSSEEILSMFVSSENQLHLP